MGLCPVAPDAGMVHGVIDTVDCHIRVLVQDTYRDLVGPNTWFAAIFTGLLTIYIALLGYQLLLGRGGLRVTQLPFAALKIGLIFAFLTSWAAYQTVFFNLLFDGPAEIMQAMLGPLGRQGDFNGDVMGGLEVAFKALSDSAGAYGGMASASANILQGGPMLGSGLLWLSAIVLLLSILGLIVAAKIVLAFLLAVGPFFIGMFLFDATRGLAEGWFRTTLAFALTPLAVNVFGAVSLMILTPFLELLVGNASRGVFDMAPVITIALIVLVLAVVMLMGLVAVGGIARGFGSRSRREDMPSMPRLAAPEPPRGLAPGERAEQIAARIAMLDHGRDFETRFTARDDFRSRPGEVADAVGAPALVSIDRLGQAYNRSPRPLARPGDKA
ncbi:MAG: hypothetical protein GC155_07545 [Alphaproteobacteria bacterium]|nr:hypothetical protein [Alphaproteobacteria bacterium]